MVGFTWNNEPVGEQARRQLIKQGLQYIEVELDDDVVERLTAYSALLVERAVPLGMISRQDADRIELRHVVDSLRALPVLRALGSRTIVDLGSGAGLPGVPLAIALADALFTLAEARSKRAAFLELVVERLGLRNATVHVGKAEALRGRTFDTATSRAFAGLDEAWRVARPLLRLDGALVVFAGSNHAARAGVRGARVEVLPPQTNGPQVRSSASHPLASAGDLVIIRAT
jgi:16S rRNA (guanine527-N7)-methyltransferase